MGGLGRPFLALSSLNGLSQSEGDKNRAG